MNEAKIQVRLPLELRDWFAEISAANDRSMNGQIVALIKQFKQQVCTDANRPLVPHE